MFLFSAWTFHLWEKPPYIPGQIEVLAPLPLPFGYLLGRTMFLLQKGTDTVPAFRELGNLKP